MYTLMDHVDQLSQASTNSHQWAHTGQDGTGRDGTGGDGTGGDRTGGALPRSVPPRNTADPPRCPPPDTCDLHREREVRREVRRGGEGRGGDGTGWDGMGQDRRGLLPSISIPSIFPQYSVLTHDLLTQLIPLPQYPLSTPSVLSTHDLLMQLLPFHQYSQYSLMTCCHSSSLIPIGCSSPSLSTLSTHS